MDWLNHIEAVLFDLDGTLYRDDTFYKLYLEFMLKGTGHEAVLPDITSQLTRILEGRHVMQIGDWYHPERSIWIRLFSGRIEAFDWNGEEAEPDLRALDGNRSGLVYAGDAWSLVHIAAHRYRISEEKRREAFFQVRKQMLEGASGFMKHRELTEAINGLTGVRMKILLTNSPPETGREFIEALGCSGLFDEICYSAEKPAGLERYCRELMHKANVQPRQILSVGDHAWNDLYPVRKLGGRTIWISPVVSSEPERWDAQAANLDELALILKQLQQVKAKAVY